MTENEINSSIARLKAFTNAFIEYRFAWLKESDVDVMLAFVQICMEVVGGLSRYALEHCNSIDQNKRMSANRIYSCFGFARGFLNDTLMGEGNKLALLNKSIKLLYDAIVLNVESYESIKIQIPQHKSIVHQSVAVVNKPKQVVKEEKKAPKKECEIDKNSKKTVEEWDNQFDDVFDPMLDPQEIFKVLEKKSDPRVTDDYPRFFVFFRVLLYIGWIKNHQKNFLKWANCHWKLNWTKDYNFKFGNNIQKELRDTDMDKWDDKTCNGSDIGKAYRNLAIKVMSALTEKVNDGMLIDRSGFYREGVADRINDGKKMRYPF